MIASVFMAPAQYGLRAQAYEIFLRVFVEIVIIQLRICSFSNVNPDLVSVTDIFLEQGVAISVAAIPPCHYLHTDFL
jgi:hypothetical protein